jgi:deoxycytidine triphosphate deaminase
MNSSNSIIFADAPPERIEEFSVEVSVGEGWNDRYSDKDRRLWKIEKDIYLRGHGSIVVEVAEELRIPYNRYGILLPTGSLFLARGVMIASAKIEPAFHGKIKVRMYNTTREKIKIPKGTKIGSIVFFSTESTSPLPNIYKTSELSSSSIPRRTLIKNWIFSNRITVIGWIVTFLSSSMLATIILYFVYYKRLTPPPAPAAGVSSSVTAPTSGSALK